MAIVLVIIGVSAAGLISFTATKLDGDSYAAANAQLDEIETALSNYTSVLGYLPCPASTLLTQENPTANLGMPTSCLAGDTPSTNNEVRDTTGARQIRIGSLPTRALGLPDSYMFDPWGNRYTYMIIRALGVPATPYASAPIAGTNYVSTGGEIVVRDGAGNAIITPSATAIVSYVIISHGKTGRGAIPRNGGYMTASGSKTAGNVAIACATTADSENCNLDNIITDRRYNDSDPTSTAFYDDIIRWKLKSALLPFP